MNVSKIYWLWLPILWMVSQIALELTLSSTLILKIHGESGPHELIQFAVIFTAFVISLYTFFSLKKKHNLWRVVWIILMTLGCFYIAAEEISWGQSIFNWSTPEYWQMINNQSETNLHNTSRWLNQIPRYSLMAGIAVGGFIIPFLKYAKPALLPTTFDDIYPSSKFTITALCLLIIALGQKLFKVLLDEKFFERSSEIEEIFIYFFVLLYSLYIKDRFLRANT